MKRRFTAILLALCMALTLLPAQVLADGPEEDVPALEDSVTAPLPGEEPADAGETTEPAETVQPEAPELSDTVSGAESQPLPEDAPPETGEAVSPDAAGDEEPSVNLEETYAFNVTAEDAADVTAFSANLSMKIEGTYPQDPAIKYYGFEYCVGDTFSENNKRQWLYSQDGEVGSVTQLDDGSFRYTGPVSCVPGTTYTYRAIFNVVDDNNRLQEFFSGNTFTFTTPVSEDEQHTLTPDEPLQLELGMGQPAVFTFGEGVSGFYILSFELPEGSWCQLEIEKNGTWNNHYRDDPLYLEGQQKQGRVTLNGSSETPVTCTVKLSPVEITDLTDAESITIDASDGTNTYYQFTSSQTVGICELTFDINKDPSVTDPYLGYLELWNAAEKSWTDYNQLSESFTYLLSPKTDETCYLKLSLSYGVSCNITVSKREPITEFSVRSGKAIVDASGVRIPVTAEIPADCSLQRIIAAIEYRLLGSDSTGNGGQSGSTDKQIWTFENWLGKEEFFPEREYEYRAVLEFRDDNGRPVREPVYEEEWKRFTAPAIDFTELKSDENTIPPSEHYETKFLSYTPAPGERGYYTISMDGWRGAAFWNEENGFWQGYNIAKGLFLPLTHDEPLYIRAYKEASSTASVITITRISDAPEGFSICALEPGQDDINDFNAQIQMSAFVPADSAFEIGLEMNGINRTLERRDAWEGGIWNRSMYLNVLPDTEYTCRPYIQKVDENSRPVGEPVYGNEFEFTSKNSTAIELHVDEPVTQEFSDQDHHFSFMPDETGYYKFSVSGDNPGSLGDWDPDELRWNYNRFSGSTELFVYAEANVMQYFILQPENGPSASFQVMVEKFTPTVTSFSVESGEVEVTGTDIPGFTASVAVNVELPIDSYCHVVLETQHNSRNWYSNGNSAFVSGKNGEEQSVTCTLMTLPNSTCTYRVRLIPADSEGQELEDVSPVFSSRTAQFTAPDIDPNITKSLTAGTPESGTFEENELYFAFTAPEDGIYRVELDGIRRLEISDPDDSDWMYCNLEEPVVFPAKKGTPQYIHCYRDWHPGETPYRIQVTKVVPTVTGFSAVAGEAKPGELEFEVPITVTAPIGSTFSYGVEYRQEDGNQEIYEAEWINFFKWENQTFTLNPPACPGKTYTYRAFIDYNYGNDSRYESDWHTVTIPALGTEPESLTEKEWTEPVNGKSVYTFTPTADGHYLFSTEGEAGTLTILQEDGSWNRLYYYNDDEMTVNLPLKKDQRAYVIQEETPWSETPCSVMVRLASLWAVPVPVTTPGGGSSEQKQLEVKMNAKEPGKYVFVVYDQSGKFLDSYTIDKTTETPETLVAELGIEDSAYVKAFQLDGDAYRPVTLAERTPITKQ